MKAKRWITQQSAKPELKPGESYFAIRYIGFGARFRVIIGATNKDEAKKYFKKFFPAAELHSISDGTY